MAKRLLSKSRWRSFLILLAVIGPGIITSNVDNDAAGIATYSIAGAHFGYSLIWSLIPITVVLIIIQEMIARMGVVTGKGLSDLIRENFGVKITFYVLVTLIFANFGNTIAEFAGIAASMEIFGVSKYISVPLGALLVWILVVKVTYKSVEKVFLVACLVYGTYIISGFLAEPEWGAVKDSILSPDLKFSAGSFGMLIALIGTTISPWMHFYLQSAVVEKNVKLKNYKYTRADVISGSFMVNIIALFIIVACAATLHKAGIRIETGEDAALALAPLAGKYASALFAFGLLNASLFAASILPLSTAYVVCEGMGWEVGVDNKFSEAPQFYGLYSLLIFVGAAVVLWPDLPLIPVMFISQVINGVILPVILIFVLILINNEKIMGSYTNGRGFNILAWVAVIILIGLSVTLLALMCGIA
ncbi:MAG: Nramp family divalent metal transporter [Candidatus Zixiibacteriota bacterium]|nr:MAG: Nramp family divalent metal transporter [candidate division Zixibacteria bacterium]